MSGGRGFGGFSNMSDIFEQHGDIFGDILAVHLGVNHQDVEFTKAATFEFVSNYP